MGNDMALGLRTILKLGRLGLSISDHTGLNAPAGFVILTRADGTILTRTDGTILIKAAA